MIIKMESKLFHNNEQIEYYTVMHVVVVLNIFKHKHMFFP